MTGDWVLRSRLGYPLRCLREDATDPEMMNLERLTLVRDRAGRIREIRRELDEVDCGRSLRVAEVLAPRRGGVRGAVGGYPRQYQRLLKRMFKAGAGGPG